MFVIARGDHLNSRPPELERRKLSLLSNVGRSCAEVSNAACCSICLQKRNGTSCPLVPTRLSHQKHNVPIHNFLLRKLIVEGVSVINLVFLFQKKLENCSNFH